MNSHSSYATRTGPRGVYRGLRSSCAAAVATDGGAPGCRHRVVWQRPHHTPDLPGWQEERSGPDGRPCGVSGA
ncbi:hypothetical protein Ae168Ps1_2809 [Pseudonocardia sp. Ae168_Ps1]|nr:hypothetical protein Ae168Ps1_2809 [Pseudonocardia sp. Ae168_Ps1]